MVLLDAMDIISRAGFEAVMAGSADEAIRILEDRTDIAVVFTDVHMPGSMDGLKLARAVRERWPPVQLIVTSGHFDAATQSLPAGSLFLAKPYTPAQISTALVERTT
jgi:DNA-binding NtrC family response regulator